MQQLAVDFYFFRYPQAVGHFDNVNPVDKGLIVFVVFECMPFRFIGVGQNDAIKRNGTNGFGAVVVAFLGGGEQWVQHFYRCLEHFYKFHQSLVGATHAP